MWWSIQQALEASGRLSRGQYLRWDERDYRPGDRVHASRAWRNERPTRRLMPGTSVISPRARLSLLDRKWTFYPGHVYIVTGRRVRRGADPGEVILADCTVVRRLLEAR